MDFTDKNLYAYCDNNPVMREDRDGEFWHVLIGTAVGAAVGFISSVVFQKIGEGKVDWEEAGIDAATGAITGFASSMGAPSWAMVAIESTASAAKSVYSGVKKGEAPAEIVTDAIVKAGVSALFSYIGASSTGGSPSGKEMNQLYKNARNAKKHLNASSGLHPNAKKAYRGTIKTYKKNLKKYTINAIKETSASTFSSGGISLVYDKFIHALYSR